MPETSTPQAEAPAEPGVTEQTQGDPVELGDGGKKALDAERKRAAAAEKSAKALQAQLDEIKQANLSDLERAQQAAAESAARLAEYEQTTIRQRVALKESVPPELVDRLRGTTEEEYTADAQALMALVKAPTTPRPDPSQGARDGALALNGDPLLSALKYSLGI